MANLTGKVQSAPVVRPQPKKPPDAKKTVPPKVIESVKVLLTKSAFDGLKGKDGLASRQSFEKAANRGLDAHDKAVDEKTRSASRTLLSTPGLFRHVDTAYDRHRGNGKATPDNLVSTADLKLYLTKDAQPINAKRNQSASGAPSRGAAQGGAPAAPLPVTKTSAASPVLPSAGVLNATLDSLKKRGAEATKGHAADAKRRDSHASESLLTRDGENAMLNAVAYAGLPKGSAQRAAYGKAAAGILDNLANENNQFSGKQGFLSAAWGVGAMARAANILKKADSPEYRAIAPKFEAWAERTAQSQWIPIDGKTVLPSTKPELLNPWEASHASNRTMTALEATLHVAELTDNKQWMKTAGDQYKGLVQFDNFKKADGAGSEGSTFFTNAAGKTGDDSRGDAWHQTAGLAASMQICEIMKRQTGEDMFNFQGGILEKSLQHYAQGINSTDGLIPFWDVAASRFPDSPAIARMASMQQDTGNSSVGQFSWGFGISTA